jgi:hypothetical protein
MAPMKEIHPLDETAQAMAERSGLKTAKVRETITHVFGTEAEIEKFNQELDEAIQGNLHGAALVAAAVASTLR